MVGKITACFSVQLISNPIPDTPKPLSWLAPGTSPALQWEGDAHPLGAEGLQGQESHCDSTLGPPNISGAAATLIVSLWAQVGGRERGQEASGVLSPHTFLLFTSSPRI